MSKRTSVNTVLLRITLAGSYEAKAVAETVPKGKGTKNIQGKAGKVAHDIM
jgi:hypothetical protein